MKHSHALAYLRQLCCLGLAAELLVPEFLRAISLVVPSEFNVLTFVDGMLSATSAIPAYFDPEFPNLCLENLRVYWTSEKLKSAAQWFTRHSVFTNEDGPDQRFYASNLYQFFRRYDSHYAVVAPVVQHGKPVAMLCVTRPIVHKAFTAKEQQLCVQLASYLAHGLQAPVAEIFEYGNPGLSGLVIASLDGTIQYLNDSARRLLALARDSIATARDYPKETILPAQVMRLCRDLNAVFQDNNAPPPSCCHANAHGCFIFRAYWLNKENPDQGGLIGVTIEHQEPMVLQLVRAMQPLPLSPVQKEVALLMAQGLTSEQIGRRLQVKLTTVNDHIRKIFTKLDIHHRRELLPKLMAQPVRC